MMQLCVCKEGGRRNRGGNRSRSLGHQPAVEPAILPPTAPSSLTLFLHPSMPFVSPVRCVTSLRISRRFLQSATRAASVAFKFFKQCQLACTVALIILPVSLLTMFTVPCALELFILSHMLSLTVLPFYPGSVFCERRAFFANFTIFADYDVNFLIVLFTL